MRKQEKSKSKLGIIFIILIVIAIIAGGIVITKKMLTNKNNPQEVQANNNETGITIELKKIKIVDESSKTRPYAVMINNNHAAWPQCGIQDAYLVYEIVVEGGITRMLALYKDKNTEKIGSVRSARDYFIDYADENDAIFVHWGGSPQAYSRISSIGTNDIDGMAISTSFWRDTSLNRAYEHTGFTSIAKLKEYADKKGFTRDTNKELLLNYSPDEISLAENEEVQVANSVEIVYSTYHKTSYEYDAENKLYKRSMSNKANVDLVTGEQYTAKNIITYKVNNGSISNDNKRKTRIR